VYDSTPHTSGVLTTKQLPSQAVISSRVSAASSEEEELNMTTLKTVTLAAAFIAGATSLAMAQYSPSGDANGNGMPPSAYQGPGAYPSYPSSNFQRPANANNNMPPDSYKGPGAYQSYSPSEFGGNTAANAAASGGSGTHATSQRTGSAENTQKVFRNQNGYRGRRYSYYRGREIYNYAGGGDCHLVRHPVTGRLMRVCR
jgi:hypothetical protein